MADTSCPGIIANPDLAGIGTRINLYATILLAALIPHSDKATELLDELYINAIFYSLAILITALVQTIQGQLDLYHAIIVMQMQVIIHVYGTARFLLAKGFSAKRTMTIAVQAFELLIIFVPWLLYLWIKDSQFGAQPECNDLVKYVLVFVTFRATVGWIRILAFIWIAVIVLMVVGLSSVAYKFYMDQGQSRTEPGESRAQTDSEKSGAGYDDRKDLTGVEQSTACPNPDDRSSRFFWAFALLCAAFAIVNTELIVHRNRPLVQAGEDYWGFAQIVSVILILPVVLEILLTYKSQKDKRPEPKEEGGNLWGWMLRQRQARV